MYKDYPIYSIGLSDENEIFAVSLVDCPAMEVGFMAFKKEEDKEIMKFSVVNEIEHNILCCIVRADYPILRSMNGEYFYITISKDVCKQLCQKLMKDGFQQNVSLNHNGENIDGYHLQELFLKDSTKGISPIGFENIAEGSLFGIYHITDMDIWNKCLDGTFNGISMESNLMIDLTKQYNQIKKEIDMKKSIKQQIFELLAKFNSIVTDKIEIFYNDEELVVGSEVFDADRNPIADGEYTYEDKIYVVGEGKIVEIKDVVKEEVVEEVKEEIKEEEIVESPVEVEVKEEMGCGKKKKVNMEDEPITEEIREEVVEEIVEVKDERDEKIAKLEEAVSELTKLLVERDAEIADLKAKLDEPASEGVVEEFEKVTAITSKDKALAKSIAIASALKR